MKDDSGNKASLTPLGEIGEFGLIEAIAQATELREGTSLVGIGDDAAVLDHSGMCTLVTTDMLVEGVHFDLTYTPLKHLGYKSVVVNLSDIYAMNARPTQITVSLALSSRYTLEAVDELYEGIRLACSFYGVDLVGGDTTSSVSGMVISITALGVANDDEIIYRSGASETDLLVVSGDLGGAYMGLQVLEREKAVFLEDQEMQPQLEDHSYVLERQLKPEARKDMVELLSKLEARPSSMIDISDGLSSEVIHLCRASGLGAVVYEDKLPISGEVIRLCDDFKLDPTVPALSGGEDYELLFTLPVSDYDKIKANPSLTVIGHMVKEEEGMHMQSKDGQLHPLNAQGWNALLNKS
jgi:thiamine-monophosphate kinase